ncbi:MAG: hypothetical protein DHS20C16_20470 [Phycisphaerae bacterium]|nr:MAG: hypothetical protein DHS20C16_20470 [Phycisphaerae bacterium]
MDIQKDVRTLQDFVVDSENVIRDIQSNQRPVMVTSNGKPGVVIIPAELMSTRFKALKAICDLSTV